MERRTRFILDLNSRSEICDGYRSFRSLGRFVAPTVAHAQVRQARFELKNGASLVHLLNGSGIDNGEQIAERAYPVGPLKVRVKAPGRGTSVKLASSGAVLRGTRSGDMMEFTLPRLNEYELAVLE
jgi:hypothetical protein